MMAYNLKLRVPCEGVEATEELELLHELGCDQAQGYHFDRSLPIQALVQRWLELADTHEANAAQRPHSRRSPRNVRNGADLNHLVCHRI